MPRVSPSIESSPVNCSFCRDVVCYVAPGEAKRLSIRAVVTCPTCEVMPYALTDRQAALLDHVATLRTSLGKRPSLAELGVGMGVTKSRVQAMSKAIKDRGWAQQLESALLEGTWEAPEHVKPLPEVELTFDPDRPDDVDENQFTNFDASLDSVATNV